ncbi:MAG: tRNA 2-selenouridine(34) synthase MnmH [Ferruginibacter sp.]
MAITKLLINDFLEQANGNLLLDVRSPGEYIQAHLPGAINLPLFSDEERKMVGTAYKKQSREKAIKIGLDFFGPKMRQMVEAIENFLEQQPPENKNVYVYCWRGGMRSGAVCWLLNLYGFSVYQLQGGYKAYRNWVLAQFENDYHLKILGGYTGSGKTPVLHQLQQQGEIIIDLEGIANHKGSAFGALGQPVQPRQEMFENLLANALHATNSVEKNIWIEDESQRIGVLNIPPAFWRTMRQKPVYFADIPFAERLQYILKEYGCHPVDQLADAVLRIQKRLGPLETKNTLQFLEEKNYTGAFDILLRYYDKHYGLALYNRTNINELLHRIKCDNVDAKVNSKNVMQCEPVSL